MQISSKTLLIIGLLIYPFIGISYYLAGATGLILFVIFARGINGLSYCLDTIGNNTYIRRMTPKGVVASSFGYMASTANFFWAVSAIAGAFTSSDLCHTVGTLLFLVTPFALLALIPLLACT